MKASINSRACLIILDGWGINNDPKISAIEAANTPYFDSLCKKYANATLVTYGMDVGLPEGQMGNSEVGHLNIGAGRIVYQELARINKSIEDGEFVSHEALNTFLSEAQQNNRKVHLMGLVSDGGVHSHINHLKALCDVIDQKYDVDAFVHAFTDGRDVSPTSGKGFIEDLDDHVENTSVELASVIGRYYAMDRDKRWQRTKLAYDLIVNGKGKASQNLVEAIQGSYDQGVTDEFIEPIVHVDNSGTPVGTLENGDAVIFFNFRTDRPRQLVTAFTQTDLSDEGMQTLDVTMLTMTAYDDTYTGVQVMFESANLVDTMGEVMEQHGKSQVRIAETEKYPHVTFFFSGGRESAFEGETRIMVPSPKVPTYDLQPEMSAKIVTDKLIEDVQSNKPDFICLNYANTDMVGHTGVFEAAVKAAETVDGCLSRLVPVLLEQDYGVIIIADHGNSDIMINPDGTPHTAHTTNLVGVLFATNSQGAFAISDGKLADVAPSLLHIMGVELPELMTGKSLISYVK